jgi:hypothetical protein
VFTLALSKVIEANEGIQMNDVDQSEFTPAATLQMTKMDGPPVLANLFMDQSVTRSFG